MRATSIYAIVASALFSSVIALPTPQDTNSLLSPITDGVSSITGSGNSAGNGKEDASLFQSILIFDVPFRQ